MPTAPKCDSCPECGSGFTVGDDLLGPGFRECANCGQEWWTDIDYPNHIEKKQA